MQYTLLTACNVHTGSGHFWRMTTLLSLLLERGVDVLLVSDLFPVSFPQSLVHHTSHSLPESGNILVRDLRDSTIHDIQTLRSSFSTIITIDDSGKGDQLSDCSIKLLPTDMQTLPSHTDSSFPFLYGYHFFTYIRSIHTTLPRDIDISVYSEHSFSTYPVNLTSLCRSKRCCIFSGTNIHPYGFTLHPDIRYPELLLRSQICLSHFGLTLYEAALCGALPVALNPSEYHRRLADNDTSIGLVNCGTYENPDLDQLEMIVHNSQTRRSADPDILNHRMTAHLHNFLHRMEKAC